MRARQEGEGCRARDVGVGTTLFVIDLSGSVPCTHCLTQASTQITFWEVWALASKQNIRQGFDLQTALFGNGVKGILGMKGNEREGGRRMVTMQERMERFGLNIKPVRNKVISGFQAIRQTMAPVAGLEPATEESPADLRAKSKESGFCERAQSMRDVYANKE
ncbi:hypothetical protein PoB_007095900 [Plakobranchus ocellatus]|uniref:Uncharacterized protein n=1 Tax=Plakobranchus ocellatus TaxID=259542 RepID=A0AAV4DJT6_9GAST|nr:hypothetical protein PoB_007095900 [Plakobranchus ocellatus]